MQKKTIVIVTLLIFVAVGGIIWYSNRAHTPSKLDSFATCLKDSGAIFYGAFWCPHCQNQKALFGSSANLLPYVECSTPDGQSQTSVCIDKKIDGYPTWEFKDGSRQSGEVPLKTLSEKTSCPLPL